MLFEEYEKIITKGKKTEWYGYEVPEDLLTPLVREITKNITDTIDKLESSLVGKETKSPYLITLLDSIRDLPYKLNGDFYLIKKREIEDKMNQKMVKVSKTKATPKEVKVKKQTKNSSLIFGNKK